MVNPIEIYNNFIEVDDNKIESCYFNALGTSGPNVASILERTIALSRKRPSYQFLTGYVGTGKSATLLYLKRQLEKRKFYVVLVDITEEINISEEILFTELLLGVSRAVSQNLKEREGISFKSKKISSFFSSLQNFLSSEVDCVQLELSIGIAKMVAQSKANQQEKDDLKNILASSPVNFLDLLNNELFKKAEMELRRRGKSGLVVLVDNLDRAMVPRPIEANPHKKNLFTDPSLKLLKIACHCVFTIPLSLAFTTEELGHIWHRLNKGRPPLLLTVCAVKNKDGSLSQEGIKILENIILARAFPNVKPDVRSNGIRLLFRSRASIEKLCIISGGHVSQLVALILSCFDEANPPFSPEYIEQRVALYIQRFGCHVDKEKIAEVNSVLEDQQLSSVSKYPLLFHNLFIFHYRQNTDEWMAINPVLENSLGF